MTRFNISLLDAAKFVNLILSKMQGSEVFIPKIPSYRILDVVKAINKNKKIKYIGIRPGEKIHEELISAADSKKIIDKKNYFVINFNKKNVNSKKKTNEKSYNSFQNSKFLTINEIKLEIKKNLNDFDENF